MDKYRFLMYYNNIFECYTRFRAAILQSIGRELWLRFSEYWQGEKTSEYSYRIKQMIEFIHYKIPETVTRQDLSREFALTPEHINYLLKKETGMSPTQIVHRARIHLACRYLMEEGLSIKETAANVGFNDEFYFAKTLKKIMKISPRKMQSK